MNRWYLILIVFFLSCGRHQTIKLPPALLNAHAHNDYHHDRPLVDALSYGFASVEADVHLIDDTLYVAHDAEDIVKGKTLTNLYLQPLKNIVDENDGFIYSKDIPFILLVDLKSDADSTYRVLETVLARYGTMLTSFEHEKVDKGAVTVIISGNRPLGIMKNETFRYAFYDGRPDDLKKNLLQSLIPLISANWQDYFEWKGAGPMPKEERDKLKQMIDTAHKQGRKVRFWATDVISKNQQNFWHTLLDYQVDYIGTDKLDKLNNFLIYQK